MLNPKKNYLPELDGLRALAIILVLVQHVRSVEGAVPIGYLGVTVFFVLSGYLITSISLAEEASKGTLSLVGFYIRRSFRIFPLYYLMLGVYCLLILGLHMFPEKQLPLKQALPFYLVYLQEIPFFRASQGGSLPFFQSWSLGFEEKFYLVWPLICFVALRFKKDWRIPTAALLVFASSFSQYTRPYASILLGCMLALALQSASLRKIIQQNAAIGIWITTAVLLALSLAPMRFWYWDLALGIFALVFAFFLGFLVTSENYFKAALGIPPLAFVGKMSYGIYLVHLLCIGVLRGKLHIGNVWLMMFGAFGLSLTTAIVLHYSVEQPFIQWGRKLSKKATRSDSAPLISAVDTASQK
ncbi:MAG TPA: acyltransferase [Candidatus Eremiobacteraceae bacterium]|nr:acyltransferase [Candidatus Eremiobacteraceae bacterium]